MSGDVRPGPHAVASVLELAFASVLSRTIDLAVSPGTQLPDEPTSATAPAPAPDDQNEPEEPEELEHHRRAGGTVRLDSLGGIDAVVLGKAAALAGLDLAGAGEGALVDAVVAWQHIASWATAAQARVVGELLARGGSSSKAADTVVHELTAALVTSRRTATTLVGRATALAAVPQIADALADGRIDTTRADVLATYETVPAPVRAHLATDLVGTPATPGPATGLTPTQLRDQLRRAAITADPDNATQRARTATERRHVWLDPAPDQMAWLTALLPATDAARAWARINHTAHTTARTPGETRTLAQTRADTLTDLLTTTTDPADPTSTGTGTGTPDADDAGRAGAGGAGAGGRTRPAVRTVVNVTIAATTLLGLDESPAHLTGYGPLPAPLARALATDPDATWHRILTDPTTGAATDVSRTAYRPGLVLGNLVRTRDPVCTFPGCTVPAEHCDLDHIEPFDPDRPTTGQTRATNLHPVCRAHHNAKTHGGWTTRAADDGTITWHSPSHHEYAVTPTPTDTRLPIRPVQTTKCTGPADHPPPTNAPPASNQPTSEPPTSDPPTHTTPDDEAPPPF